MENTSQVPSKKCQSIFRFIFESCWDVFLPYLSNLEIGKFDLILTDVSLRKLYFSLVNEFYLNNKIYDYKELDWILKKNISLTKCHLEFSFKGRQLLLYIDTKFYATYIFTLYISSIDAEFEAFSRIALMCPNLVEISGKNIDEVGLRALGRLNGSCLSIVKFDFIFIAVEALLDMAIDVLCKGSPSLKSLRLIEAGTGPTGITGNYTDAAVQCIIQHCPNIEVLSLCSWTRITDLSMIHLTHLPRLRELDLPSCHQLTSAGVQGLLNANRELESLMLSNVDRDNDELAALINGALLTCIGLCCHNLVKLHLRFDNYTDHSDITSASFEAMIKGLPVLEDLLLDEYTESNTILPMLGRYCPRLKTVHIDEVACTDDDFVSMCRGCPLIESLDISFLRTLTDISMLAVAAHCPMLKRLSISYIDSVTDDSLCVLFTQCIHLTSVTLTNLHLITNKSILTLLKYCPQLRYLSLTANPRLTDYCIQAIITYCPLIESLDLWHISTLTHETIVQISRYCKQLRAIVLHCCHNISYITVVEILKNCKLLTYIYINSSSLHMSDEFKTQCNELAAKRWYRTLHLTYKDQCTVVSEVN